MLNIFKAKSKTPAELVRSTKDSIQKLDGGGDVKKANEEISKCLVSMKNILYGDGENEPNVELSTQLASEAINSDLLVLLIYNITSFEFEVRR